MSRPKIPGDWKLLWVRLLKSEHSAVKRVSKKEGVSMSEIFRGGLKLYLKRYGDRGRKR